MILSIKATALIPGDVIIEGKSGIAVKKISPCSLTVLRGLPKIHVNETLCYDSIADLQVIRGKDNAS